ncbi:phage major capsid protein [Azospirillum sp.]|uniref:phage major capsid protein n=1 Tax=Azospirillum sp. TaxID=34012 RepID=UPI003D752313
MPDGMFIPADLEKKDGNNVTAEIEREIRSIGGNIKTLQESVNRDLEAVRKVAEEAKGAIGPEVKSQIDALTESVLAKMDAATKPVSERLDGIEARMNRPGAGGFGGNGDDGLEKRAAEFARTALAVRGNLKAGTVLDAKTIDVEGYKAWEQSFGLYLRSKDDRAIEEKALSVGSDPDGGQLVPTAVSNRIVMQVYETSPLRQLATVETIGTDSLEIPNDLGEFDAGWVGETEGRTETNTSTLGVLRIPVHEIYAKPKATQKMLEDASVNIETWIATKIADKFSRTEASAFISGNGVKKPRGILTYPSGTSGAKIEQIASGGATTVTADGLINVMIALKDWYASGASWLMRRASVGAVMLLKDGDGQYIWRPGLEAGKPSTLLGSPVYQAADMPAIGAGTLPIAFGNFRAGYTVVDRLGITVLRDPYSAKPFVEFYSRKRVGGDVVNFEAFKLMVVSAS